jgi:hypothetical protein
MTTPKGKGARRSHDGVDRLYSLQFFTFAILDSVACGAEDTKPNLAKQRSPSVPDVPEQRHKGEQRVAESEPTSNRSAEDTVGTREASESKDLTQLSLSSERLDERGCAQALLAQNSPLKGSGNAPRFYAEARVGSPIRQSGANFARLVD